MVVCFVFIILIDVLTMIFSVISLSFSAIIGGFLALLFSAVTTILFYSKEKEAAKVGNQILYFIRLFAIPLIIFAVPFKIVNKLFVILTFVSFVFSSLLLIIPTSAFKNRIGTQNKYKILQIVMLAISSFISVGILIGSGVYYARGSVDWYSLQFPITILVGILLSIGLIFLKLEYDFYLGVLSFSFFLAQIFVYIGLLTLNSEYISFSTTFQNNFLMITMPFIIISMMLLNKLVNKQKEEIQPVF